jgi:hypothetical protein
MRKPCAFASQPCARVRFGGSRSITHMAIERTRHYPRASPLRHLHLNLDPCARFGYLLVHGLGAKYPSLFSSFIFSVTCFENIHSTNKVNQTQNTQRKL